MSPLYLLSNQHSWSAGQVIGNDKVSTAHKDAFKHDPAEERLCRVASVDKVREEGGRVDRTLEPMALSMLMVAAVVVRIQFSANRALVFPHPEAGGFMVVSKIAADPLAWAELGTRRNSTAGLCVFMSMSCRPKMWISALASVKVVCAVPVASSRQGPSIYQTGARTPCVCLWDEVSARLFLPKSVQKCPTCRPRLPYPRHGNTQRALDPSTPSNLSSDLQVSQTPTVFSFEEELPGMGVYLLELYLLPALRSSTVTRFVPTGSVNTTACSFHDLSLRTGNDLGRSERWTSHPRCEEDGGGTPMHMHAVHAEGRGQCGVDAPSARADPARSR
ncbi:hypothetical protein KM043_016574 [Ampulex compressa]|nr:hypothetical protein KM043_016574 [Ampulex compressa]